jgi:hypothetical protein
VSDDGPSPIWVFIGGMIFLLVILGAYFALRHYFPGVP